MTNDLLDGARLAAPTAAWVPEPGIPGRWTTTLHVDQEDGFYFDHPLDHVPGMLLVTGLLGVARDAAGGRWVGRRVRLALRFDRFCELEPEVALHCSARGPNSWELRAEQAGQVVCRGVLDAPPERGDGGTPSAPAGPSTAPAPRPAAADLVHRFQGRNIMSGELACPQPGVYTAAVLSSDAFPYTSGYRAPEEIIEAARQMCIMLGLVAHARPQDSQVLWLDVETDLPGGTPRDVPLALRWRETPPDRARARFELDLVGPDHGPRLGTVTCGSHTMSRRAYEKRRARGGAA